MNQLAQCIAVSGLSDSGKIRSHNEDSIVSVQEIGLLILADGMGGYNAGEVASGITTNLLAEDIKQTIEQRPPEKFDYQLAELQGYGLLRDAIFKANHAVYQTAQSQPQCAGMGTTLVMGLFFDNKLMVAHIGDSRIYRLRGGEFKAISRDHSLLQEQIDSGLISLEEARFSQNRNLVTRALGVEETVDPEIHHYDVEVGDIYLLCSDGLNDMVEDDDISLILNTLKNNLPLAADQLIQLANDNGGKDNVSVLLARVDHAFPIHHSWWRKLLAWF